ncbi:MAG: hypothetical protein WBA76_02360 [Phormidesmis sp.]
MVAFTESSFSHHMASPNPPNNQQNPPPDPSTGDELLSFLQELKRFVRNDSLLSWLSRHAVLGNLLLVLLTGYSGISLVELLIDSFIPEPEVVDPDNMSMSKLCSDQIQQLANEESNLSNSQVLVTEAPDGSNLTGLKFGCKYIGQDGVQLQETVVQVQPIPIGYVKGTQYVEEPVTRAELGGVCRSSEFYISTLENLGYSKNEYNIVPRGEVFNKAATNVYPVFRWACKYDLTTIAPPNSDSSEAVSRYSGAATTTVLTGIDMDKDYCSQFENRGLTKSTYRSYNDPYSWVCTNIKFDR